MVELEDIKGDLHCHSTWTDGFNKIEETAKFLLENYKYEYFAITDHSKAVRVAHGLTELEINAQPLRMDLPDVMIKKQLRMELN